MAILTSPYTVVGVCGLICSVYAGHSGNACHSSHPGYPGNTGYTLYGQLTHKRVLRHTLEKAARKFNLGSNWLAPSVDASALGLPLNLVQRSREQNQVLFVTTTTSTLSDTPSLVLRSLDHLYTFKAALCSYAQTGDHYRLEDAVDELRRYILAQAHHGGAHCRRQQLLSKRELLRQYPTLSSFSETHLADVNRMYRRAYGGPELECGIEADGLSSSPPVVVSSEATSVPIPVPSTADKLPRLSLETNCVGSTGGVDADEEQATPTAAPAEKAATPPSLTWTSFLNISSSDPPMLLPLLGSAAERRNRFRRKMDGEERKEGNGQDKTREDESDNASDVLSETSTIASSLPSLSSSLLSILSDDEDLCTTRGPKELSVVIEDSESPVLGAVKSRVPEFCTSSPSSPIILRPASARPFATSPAKVPSSPNKLLPVLTLQTSFDTNPTKTTKAISSTANESPKDGKGEEEEEEQLTARPINNTRMNGGGSIFFGAASIGEMLQDVGDSTALLSPAEDTVDPFHLPRFSRASILVSPVVAGAPQPPKDYDDISPITRSEWGFLMGDQTGRQVTVTTF
ncbi:hypothetical protein SPBR_02580 [Sporothrix brasiliensis 5110]|uniref:DUF7582 domain-containing protein n=1 Tax=Sporothrix brasiliensis 5110 TaxID=1398154 RepID=A0A0C2FPH4_9PEZI|nr:uncharacterized protein SPBR_02580 [Sporothrix brasiliensis 5110]KIH92968.1 hypothetical protein SPBR_02580 [Sporothrix brasiliensis 5110]